MILSMVFEKQLRLTDVAESLALKQVGPAKVVTDRAGIKSSHALAIMASALPSGNTASMDPAQCPHFCGFAHCRRYHVGDENVSPAERRLP